MTEYEEIGVTISLDRKGRHIAKRVFINGNKVVATEVLTEGRNGSKAMEEALRSLGLILHQAQRGEIGLVQPPPVKMILENSK